MIVGGALRLREAAAYVGMSPRWMKEAPIPKCDMRQAGGERPVWVWRKLDLECFLEERRVKLGGENRMERAVP